MRCAGDLFGIVLLILWVQLDVALCVNLQIKEIECRDQRRQYLESIKSSHLDLKCVKNAPVIKMHLSLMRQENKVFKPYLMNIVSDNCKISNGIHVSGVSPTITPVFEKFMHGDFRCPSKHKTEMVKHGDMLKGLPMHLLAKGIYKFNFRMFPQKMANIFDLNLIFNVH